MSLENHLRKKSFDDFVKLSDIISNEVSVFVSIQKDYDDEELAEEGAYEEVLASSAMSHEEQMLCEQHQIKSVDKAGMIKKLKTSSMPALHSKRRNR